jgi:rubredoxin
MITCECCGHKWDNSAPDSTIPRCGLCFGQPYEAFGATWEPPKGFVVPAGVRRPVVKPIP